MTDNHMENTPGTAAQPTPSASGTSSAMDVTKLVEALTPHIESLIDRKTQSVKDKRIAGLQGEIDGFRNQLAQLKQLQSEGWTEAQALRLMENQPKTVLQAEPQQTPTGKPAQAASLEATVFEVFGFSPNDPEIAKILRDAPDPLAQVNNLAKLAQQRKGISTPNVAQQMPMGSAPTGTHPKDAALAELDRLIAKAGKSNTDWSRMAELQKTLKELE